LQSLAASVEHPVDDIVFHHAGAPKQVAVEQEQQGRA